MRAFHNDPKIKQKYLARVREHEKADEIIKGKYWEHGISSAVGCTIHGSDHAAYETELGIPGVLARLEDGIFEALPMNLAKTWPKRFLSAIKPGADLSLVWSNFAVWLLTDDEFGVLQFAKTEADKEAIQAVSDMYLFKIAGAEIDENDWRMVRLAADASAAYAAYAASGVYHAAYAVDAAAAYTAYAAASAYADAAAYDAAARTKARIAQSDKLLQLLSEAM